MLLIIFTLVGCSSVDVAPPAQVQPLPQVRVVFDSFVNSNYGKRRSLHGWQTTQTAIETTLKLWYDQMQVRQTVADGTPADLQRFLLALPGPEECDISVVYLGSIQNAAADWEFVNGDIANWRTLLAAAPPPAHPCRIVILDACSAAAVRNISAWAERLGTVTLLASDTHEETYQFSPSALLPINVQNRYPLAWAWAQTRLPPDWSKHISFLGLMWIETVAKRPSPPADKTGWTQFFYACGQNAATFQQTISQRWGSTLMLYAPLTASPAAVPY